MTKVEELRAVVYNDVAHYLLDCGHNENGEKEAADEIDSLISAAHAKGVAEGTEREREKIRQWIDEPDPANFGQCIHVSVFGEFQLVNLTDLLSVLNSKEPPCSG